MLPTESEAADYAPLIRPTGYDFTSASCRSSARQTRAAASSRPSLPAPRVVTIARNAPLVEAG